MASTVDPYELSPEETSKINHILQSLNSSNGTRFKGKPRLNRHRYNCWGFTASMLKWTSGTYWLDEEEMEELLEKRTKRVSRPRRGDIVVFRDEWDDLTHTAIITNGRTRELIHKPGNLPLEFSSIQEVYIDHPCYERVAEYRRPLKRGMKHRISPSTTSAQPRINLK